MDWPHDLSLLPLEDLFRIFLGPVSEEFGGEEYARAYYNDIGYALGDRGKAGRAFLLEHREHVETDEARLGAVFLGISLAPANPTIHRLLRPYLHDVRALVVMDALEALRHQKDHEIHDEVLALLNHPSQFVRGAVLRYLQDLYPKEAIPYAVAALHDPDYIVRESAIDVLDELPAVEALPLIRPFLDDPHHDVRQAAETAIQHLEYILVHPEDVEIADKDDEDQ